MNPVCQSLVETIGLRNTYRTLAALSLVIGIPCCLVFKQPPMDTEDEDTRSLEGSIESAEVEGAWLSEMIKQEELPEVRKLFGVRTSLWLDPIYILYMFGQLFKGIGYVFPFIHLVSSLVDNMLKLITDLVLFCTILKINRITKITWLEIPAFVRHFQNHFIRSNVVMERQHYFLSRKMAHCLRSVLLNIADHI